MSGISNEPLLTICIPTYNRGEHVHAMVNSILKINSDEIEIYVQDNCSTDNTKSLLEGIKDDRFRYHLNEKNIGGKLNSALILTKAKGTYSFLCLDRDLVNASYVELLLEKLRSLENVSFGYCALGLTKVSQDVMYDQGFDSLSNMCYLSKHPSGNFYETSILKQLTVLDRIVDTYADFDFIHEFMNEESSFLGKSIVINIPIITTAYTSNKGDFAKHKSYSYNKTNYYFNPVKRIFHCEEYFKAILALVIPQSQKNLLIKKVLYLGYRTSIHTFKNALKDPKICSHYNIQPRNVSFVERLKINKNLTMFFLRFNTQQNMFVKIGIVLTTQIRLFLFLTKLKLKGKS